MYCKNRITYVVRPGDTLYSIAIRYNTTVQTIISENRQVDPRNLRIGEILTICPNSDMRMPRNQMGRITPAAYDLINEMQMAWQQHIEWTHMFLISTLANLPDKNQVTARLLRNPEDIAQIYSQFYPPRIANEIAALIREHLMIASEYLTALINKDDMAAEDARRRWYANADEIAAYLSSINPQYDIDRIRSMMFEHLDLLSRDIGLRMAGNYSADVAIFDEIEKQAQDMANEFAQGIIRQFPNNFL